VKQVWIKAYEDNNVDAGFRTKLSGKGQVASPLPQLWGYNPV